MKKIFFALSLVVLVAAGCTSNQNTTSQNNTPAPVVLKLDHLTPASGPANTQVTITGQGFDKTGNQIMFGTAGASHHPDGTADNVIATADSADGTTLTFTVPTSGPSGILCDASNHCVGVSAMLRQAGAYPVLVKTSTGTSNSLNFTLTR